MKLTTFLEKIAELAGGFEVTEEMVKLGKNYTKFVLKAGTKGAAKERDPDAPVRPSNEYIIFSQEMRTSVKEKNPSLGPKEITSKLAEMWRSEKEKNSKVYKEYQQKFAAKMVVYEKEKSTYEKSHSDDSEDDGKADGKATKKSKAKKTADDAPKKMSTYNLFCSNNLKLMKAKFPEKTSKELMGMAAAEWKKLSDEEKKNYTGNEVKATDAKKPEVKSADAKKPVSKVVVKDSHTELDSDEDDTPPPPKKAGKSSK